MLTDELTGSHQNTHQRRRTKEETCRSRPVLDGRGSGASSRTPPGLGMRAPELTQADHDRLHVLGRSPLPHEEVYHALGLDHEVAAEEEDAEMTVSESTHSTAICTTRVTNSLRSSCSSASEPPPPPPPPSLALTSVPLPVQQSTRSSSAPVRLKSVPFIARCPQSMRSRRGSVAFREQKLQEKKETLASRSAPELSGAGDQNEALSAEK
ncbi:hypothetical protein AOLI_G00169580 [Acnodon oligacanthus]